MENVRIPWDDWKVVRQLGKGSYGTVYEIERTLDSRVEKAAMKVIPIPPNNQIIEDAYSEGYDYESVLTICKSFYNDTLNEYKLMQSLRGHSNIVACEDIASLPMKDTIGWEVYIRMELLTPLLKYQSSSEIDEKEIIKLGKDICQALMVCESNDIVHRDVKPGNIFVDKYGNYKLGDFGVARTLDHSTNATRVGTERFMAPEVINRKPYDKSVDIYSLGLVMYWLLNGRRMPFLTPNRIPTAKEQENAYYRRISGENLWLPQNGSLPLKKVVLKACSFDRDARYQSAQEMLHALNEAEYSLAQMTNHANSRSSSNAFNNMNEDETIGNSWNFEDATVGAGFGSKSKGHNSASYGHVYEDKTVGPGWTVTNGMDNNTPAPDLDSMSEEKPKERDGCGSTLFHLIRFFVVSIIASLIVTGIYNHFNSSDVASYTLKEDPNGVMAVYYDNGELNDNYNGIIKDEDSGVMYYIEDGYMNDDYTGIVRFDEMECWYYVENGKVNTSINGDHTFEDGSYVYIQNGKVIEGTINIESSGKVYHIKNGEEISE